MCGANTFAADFFLWFRYQDELNLDPHEVEFPTAVSGATLGKEVGHRTRAGFTTVTYHVKGVFRSDYEFSRFPFDQQLLKIPIQFHNSNNYTMILAYGGSGRAAENGKSGKRRRRIQFGQQVVAVEESDLFPGRGRLQVLLWRRRRRERQSGVEVNRINAAHHDRTRCVRLRSEEFPAVGLYPGRGSDWLRACARCHQSPGVHRSHGFADHFGALSKAGGRLTHGHLHHRNGLCFLCVFRLLRHFSYCSP